MEKRPQIKSKEKTTSYRKPALDLCQVPLESKRNKEKSTPHHNICRIESPQQKHNSKPKTSQLIQSHQKHRTHGPKHRITQTHNSLDDTNTRSRPENNSLESLQRKQWSNPSHSNHRERIWFNSCLFHRNKLNGSRRI